MKLLRAHGLGNDYLVYEDGPGLNARLVREICNRHTGVGSDGILEPSLPVGADYGVRIWNPDGSQAEKSGNGLRIFARWLHSTQGAADRFTIWTGHDIVRCHVGVDAITVAMGRARCAAVTLDVDGRKVDAITVDLGNPHCVLFVPDLDIDWRSLGAALETHSHFPKRTNVQFAKQAEPTLIDARIWERGAGETQASGSSACAVVAAAVFAGRLDIGIARVRMPGGSLTVTADDQLQLTLKGPVEMVARIELLEGFVERILEEG